MREVLPGVVWLGTAADIRRSENLGPEISAVIDLAIEERPQTVPRSIAYCRFPILDGQPECQPVLQAAVEAVVALLKNSIPTLVCCSSGMSRSPAVAAAALSLARGGEPADWLARTVAGQPHDISPGLWAALEDVCRNARQRQP